MSDAFDKSWRIAKEDDDDCDCITTDMSGKCTHCLRTPEEQAKRDGRALRYEDSEEYKEDMKKAMTDEEMVYVKMPKSMLSWIEEMMNPSMHGQESKFPDEHKNAHSAMPNNLGPIIEMLSQNPEMWMHSGTDTGGDFQGLSRGRPSEQDLFQGDWEMKDDERQSLSGRDQYSDDFPYDLNYRLGYDRIGEGNYGESGFSYDHDRHNQRGRVESMNMMELLSRLASDDQNDRSQFRPIR